eukprot:11173060-Lingulodinium_polyedra.AAC.1
MQRVRWSRKRRGSKRRKGASRGAVSNGAAHPGRAVVARCRAVDDTGTVEVDDAVRAAGGGASQVLA